MIFEKVRTIITEQLDREPEEITLETDFRKEFDADSLDLFQIINDIEDEFDIKIEEAEDINTVGDVVKIIESQLK